MQKREFRDSRLYAKTVARFAVEAEIKTHSPYPSDSIGFAALPHAKHMSVDNKALICSHINGLSNQLVTAKGLRRGESRRR
jgi:hypothetical protein